MGRDGLRIVNLRNQYQKVHLEEQKLPHPPSNKSLKILKLLFSQFTFDFLMLLMLASMIAFMGLIENNTVVLVASMLVSPIMGPILAGIFGSVVGDDKWDIFSRSAVVRNVEWKLFNALFSDCGTRV